MTESAPRPSTEDAPHPAVFESASVHFTYGTNAKKPLDIYRASRRLIAADVATSAAWPDSTKIYVPARLGKQGKNLYRVRRLPSDLRELRDSPTWRRGLRFAVRHRDRRLVRAALQSVWAQKMTKDIARIRKDPVPLWDLLWFAFRHPIVFVRRVLPSLRVTRANKPKFENEQVLGAETPETEETSGTADAEGDDFAEFDGTNEMLDKAERAYIDQQIISAAERVIDEDLFGGRDRDESRFVRLVLRQSYHELRASGREGTQSVVFEPRLFLHESGAIQSGAVRG